MRPPPLRLAVRAPLGASLLCTISIAVVQVFGLGNTGYQGTRHNVGEAFLEFVLRRLQDVEGCKVGSWHNDRKAKCDVSTAHLPVVSLIRSGMLPLSGPGRRHEAQRRSQAASSSAPVPDEPVPVEAVPLHTDVELLLCKPHALMNVSGLPVRAALEGLKPDSFCVVHDGASHCLSLWEARGMFAIPFSLVASRRLGAQAGRLLPQAHRQCQVRCQIVGDDGT